jgi:hypothetical protein
MSLPPDATADPIPVTDALRPTVAVQTSPAQAISSGLGDEAADAADDATADAADDAAGTAAELVCAVLPLDPHAPRRPVATRAAAARAMVRDGVMTRDTTGP